MPNHNMITYESVKLTGKGKYIDIYRTLYYHMMVDKALISMKFKKQGIKNNYNHKNMLMDA